MRERVRVALAAIGGGRLEEWLIQQHVAGLFSRVLGRSSTYLANHSLGRPLDAMGEDVGEAVRLWYEKLGDAWDEWLEEREAFRVRIAALIGAERADCVVPKTSAGQGLRAVLNALPGRLRVVSTRGEFDSVDVILKQYAALGRIAVRWVEPDAQGDFCVGPLIDAVNDGAELVVVSQVMFQTGQIVTGLDRLARACHERGAKLLVDAYHAVGIVPVDVMAMGADFVIGGSYKYLRGGPGASFLYLAPEVLESGLRPLDTGWFANTETFEYRRAELPVLKPGGGSFLESTPPVLTWYQARSGAEFALGVGVARLRAYSLEQLGALRGYLAEAGVGEVRGGDETHGAFLAIRLENAVEVEARLERERIVCDARGEWLRLCPDCLTRHEELRGAAEAVGRLVRGA